MAHRVLLVEDDERIRTSMRLSLEDEGYEVEEAGTGEEAIELQTQALVSNPFDLLVVDIMLPGMDGFECCRELRKASAVPIIMVTARTDTHDVVAGLEAGADDYVTKPFSPRELVARIRAILRRAEPSARNDAVTQLRVGEVEVDLDRHEVRTGGEVVALTAREFDLLAYLAENEGFVLSRRQLLDGVWGADWIGDDRTVDVHVRQLRKKLGGALPLSTVWGVGYRLG